MKKLLLFSCICLLSMINIAQTYTPFPTENIRWRGSVFTHEEDLAKYDMAPSGDTTINGLVYTKIWRKEMSYPWDYQQGIHWNSPTFTEGYYGCYRNDSINKKVYFIWSYSNTETLWYDFNLQIGDTINYGLWGKVISDIDSILIKGKYQKRYRIDSCGSGPNRYNYFIEGIGSTYGPKAAGYCILEGDESLSCVTIDGELVFARTIYDSACVEITSIDERNVHNSLFRVYPTPATEEIHFDIAPKLQPGSGYELRLYDMVGKLVLTQTLQPYENTISISHLKAGIYNYRLNETWGQVVIQ